MKEGEPVDITEWIISGALIAVVIRQLRGRKLTLVGLLWPVPLVAWGAVEYLGGVPSDVADWSFIVVLIGVGLALGAGCALLTHLYREDGVIKARAGWLAAALWVAGMSARLAFGLFATSGGGATVAAWSADLGLHAAGTWASALIAMALVEVLVRSSVLFVRSRRMPAVPSAVVE